MGGKGAYREVGHDLEHLACGRRGNVRGSENVVRSLVMSASAILSWIRDGSKIVDLNSGREEARLGS